MSIVTKIIGAREIPVRGFTDKVDAIKYKLYLESINQENEYKII